MIEDPTAHLFKKAAPSVKIQGPPTPAKIKVMDAGVDKAVAPKKSAKESIDALTNKALERNGVEQRAFRKKMNTPPPVWHVPNVGLAKLPHANAPVAAEGDLTAEEDVADRVEQFEQKLQDDAQEVEDALDAQDEARLAGEKAKEASRYNQTLAENAATEKEQRDRQIAALLEHQAAKIKQAEAAAANARRIYTSMTTHYNATQYNVPGERERVLASGERHDAAVATLNEEKDKARDLRQARLRYMMQAAAHPAVMAARVAAAKARAGAGAGGGGANKGGGAAAGAAGVAAGAAGVAAAGAGGAGAAAGGAGAGRAGGAAQRRIDPPPPPGQVVGAGALDAAMLLRMREKYPSVDPVVLTQGIADGYKLNASNNLMRTGQRGGVHAPAAWNVPPSPHAASHPGTRGGIPERVAGPRFNGPPPPVAREAHQ